MMAYSEDHIALAAEYALGTLDADERAQVETMMSVDTDFTAMVEAWEYRLGVLNQMVGSVEPRPIVWDKIRAAVGHSAPQAPLVLPEAPPPSAAPVARRTSRRRRACSRRRQFQRHPVVRAGCGAGATSHPLPSAIAAALVAMIGAAGLSAGSAARRACAPSRARRWSRSRRRPAGAAVGAICRGAAEGWRLARLHSHGRRRDQEFHGAQGRRAPPSPARALSSG